jgi:hypothetical protein
MGNFKKYLGILWIAIGLTAGYFNVFIMGIPKLRTGKQDDLVFAIINLGILTPIIVGGLLIFGWYAITGEYKEEK